MKVTFRFFITAIIGAIVFGCADSKNPSRDSNAPGKDQKGEPSASKIFLTPTRKLLPNEWPNFFDDLDFAEMTTAINLQLKRYAQLDLNNRFVELGGVRYSGTVFKQSLEEFKRLSESFRGCKTKSSNKNTCVRDFNSQLRQKFNVFAPELAVGDPRYNEAKPTLFTAYFTPTLEGSLTKTSKYSFAIYSKPPAPYTTATRQDIDFKNVLAGKGLELFYTENLFDLYLLHIQGGGIVRVKDSTGATRKYYISYDSANGQSMRFISKYMLEKGYITNASIEAQRDFLARNPDKHEEIFSTSPAYVYFKITNHPPLGNDIVPLTDNRSIATDVNHYGFKGCLAFVETRRPANPYDPNESPSRGQYKPMSRFYLDQDTGGAIRGKARVDIYFGESRYAEVAAYNTVERGNLYFLLLKP